MELPGFFDELDKLLRKYVYLSGSEWQVIRELQRYTERTVEATKEIPRGMVWSSERGMVRDLDKEVSQ